VSGAGRRWADGYAQAWRALDAEAAAALYAEDVVARTAPLRPPARGRKAVLDYTRRVFAEESEHEVWFGEPVEAGDRAAVEWWATYLEDGREVTLSGCSMLRFGPDGLVLESRDYWHEEEGRRPPPAGWGR
jgi:ketosteroid isomerase-like protein